VALAQFELTINFDSETVYYSLIWQVWDLIKLADYLTQREDIDPSRIGITGISLGGWLREVDTWEEYVSYKICCDSSLTWFFDSGMHAWFAAAADTRYAVISPLIGVQVTLYYWMKLTF
jgi:hypothetical protein